MKELSVWYLCHSFHYSQPGFNHIEVNKSGKSLEMASKTMEPKDKRSVESLREHWKYQFLSHSSKL